MRARLCLLLCGVALGGGSVVTRAADPMVPDTDEKKAFYVLGMAMSQRLESAKLTPQDLAWIQAGLADGILGQKPKADFATYAPMIEDVLQARLHAAAEQEKKAGQAFRDRLAAEPGAQKTPTGMLYFEQRAGTGAAPGPTDTVKVHYHGTLRDGKVFDSSRSAGAPVSFDLDQVVDCFEQGIVKMKVGGKSKLVCPSDLAYGDEGNPPTIPGGATLVFEVELLEVVAPPAAPTAAAPANPVPPAR